MELLRYLLGEPGTTTTNIVLGNFQSVCRAHINLQNNYGNTPLIVAVLYNHVDCIGFLLDHGADITIRGEGGFSALDFAIKRHCIEADMLLRSHADKAMKNKGDP
jgi:ankyrin repeat protein